ncbi:endonuclease/exonuclease/phosphatase family protein [Populibacterium corticicola]|uniref:Endonuclease/exonuclease/phosphatase family protein n=1 Tax=Populibacterium corticicola TaxID=1812826 RepID=A0ABW5XG06_9MICO
MKRTVAAALAAVLTLGSAVATAVPAAASSSSDINYVKGANSKDCVPASKQTSSTAPKISVLKKNTSTQGIRVSVGRQASALCYEIQYSTNSTFAKNVTTVQRGRSGTNNPEQTISSLKDNTRYYFRVRSVQPNGNASKWSSSVNEATKARAPKPITTSWKHTAAGNVQISWKHNGAYTKSIRLHVASSSFAQGKRGQNHQVFNLPANARSYTLTSADLKALGAPVGSGRVLRFRVEARNTGATETRVKYSSGSAAAIVGQPLNKAPKSATTLTIASYNVTSASANPSNKKWANRKKTVAQQIVNSKAGIVGVQEAITLKQGNSTQIKQLLSEVKAAQKKKDKKVKWKLTRDTRYIKRGKPGGNDGQRILYDSAKYKMVSKCKNTTGKGKNNDYSSSCTVKLPRVGAAKFQRFAQVVQFEDKKTKQRFWVVNTHLEHRKGAKYDKNRDKQVATILNHVKKVNKANKPVFFLGDLNSSNKRAENLKTIDRLLKNGYIDSASAKKTKNIAYHTYNNWQKQKASPAKFGSRIDFILGKGKNVHFSQYTTVKNGYKASDHNLIKATVKFTD